MQLLLYNLPIINQWNQFHTVTKFPSPYLSRRSLLTAPWAMCVRVHTVRVCYGAFCSVVVLGLAGGTRLGVRSSASQPNAENVLPAPSNIFSNTLHSFLTCTTTSAQTTLSLSPLRLLPRAAPQVVHKRSIVPLGFYLCIKSFTMHLVAACASSG